MRGVAKLDIAYRILNILATWYDNKQTINIRFNHTYLCVKVCKELKLRIEDDFSQYHNIYFTELMKNETYLIEWKEFD